MDYNHSKGPSRKGILIAIALIGIVAAVPSYYFYSRSQHLLKNPTEAAKEEAKDIATKVANLIDVGSGEQPAIATISDKNKLKGQAFFVRAENGDKVLVYSDAKKAILYRPSTNKIIEVAPANIDTNLEQASQAASPSAAVNLQAKVAVYNGTTISGLASTTITTLKDKMPQLTVTKGNTLKNYSKTVVIDLKGTNKELTQQIATLVGGTVSTLPSGEAKPDADVLVIVGK